MNGLFYASVCKFENHVKVVFVDSNVNKKLIDVLFMIDKFFLCLDQ